MLRQKGVVGRFVEFFGPGLDGLPLADRATIANMAPEYGATCGFFPIDEQTLDYLRLTGRPRRGSRWSRPMPRRRACGGIRAPEPVFTDTLELDMSTVEPSLAGPKRPQDKVLLSEVDDEFNDELDSDLKKTRQTRASPVEGESSTSAMATSSSPRSPAAPTPPTPRCWSPPGWWRARRAPGPEAKPWVKTSLAPGSQVVTDYLTTAALGGSRRARLQPGRLRLHHLHRQFGAAARADLARRSTTMIWSPLSVLSGNRNFEGRVSPDCAPTFSPRRRWWSPMRSRAR